MNRSELLAMIDITADHGQPVPTLDDYTEALATTRQFESLATFTQPLGAMRSQQAANQERWLRERHERNRALMALLGNEPRR